MQWTERIGRRIKLRDLHILMAVAQAGNMSRAAERLAISFPVVSKTISELERSLGVRLFDRSATGVRPTTYGLAVLDCGTAVFDELKRGVQKIEFLSDPAAGELNVGSSQPLAAGLLALVIDDVLRRHPRMVIRSRAEDGRVLRNSLRERTIDIAVLPEIGGVVDEMLAAEFLFDEQLLVVAAPPNPWTNRRRIDLAELADELWAVPVPDLAPGIIFSNHFRARGLSVPSRAVVSDSVHLRARLVATGLYLSVLPESMLRFGLIGHGIKALPLAPLDDPVRYEILTVKNRTISPAAALFIENLRGAAGSLVPTPRRQREKASGRPGRG